MFGYLSVASTAHTIGYGSLFLALAIILLAASVSNVVERFGQPPVVGQLLAGMALAGLGYLGWDLMQQAASSTVLAFVANFGAIILLLSAGMGSRVRSLAKVAPRATIIAAVGVVLPFLSGTYVLGPWLFPGQGTNAYLFLGAALVATSVSISVAVFNALEIMRTRAAQTVLAAAVFDDIIGLVILGVVSELAVSGNISTGAIVSLVLKSIGFLFGSLLVGRSIARYVSRLMGAFNNDSSTRLVLAVSLAWRTGITTRQKWWRTCFTLKTPVSP